MLQAYHLPSIRRFASDIWEVLEQRELVVISSPRAHSYTLWCSAIVAALEDVAREKYDPKPIILSPLSGDETRPLSALSVALELPSEADIMELLECFGRSPICVITIVCIGSLSQGWKRLFSDISRNYRASQEMRQRPVLAIVVGCNDYPPIDADIGIRVRALWNVIRWEETRLLIESRLRSNENSFLRAWRIAVYCATSNADIDVVSRLCTESPNSLADAIECSLDALECGCGQNASIEIPFLPDQRWSVPAAVVSSWISGRILGSSLERGTSLSVKHISPQQAQVYLYHAVWREQVSGLLPIVMEMGMLANQAARTEIIRSTGVGGLDTSGTVW